MKSHRLLSGPSEHLCIRPHTYFMNHAGKERDICGRCEAVGKNGNGNGSSGYDSDEVGDGSNIGEENQAMELPVMALPTTSVRSSARRWRAKRQAAAKLRLTVRPTEVVRSEARRGGPNGGR